MHTIELQRSGTFVVRHIPLCLPAFPVCITKKKVWNSDNTYQIPVCKRQHQSTGLFLSLQYIQLSHSPSPFQSPSFVICLSRVTLRWHQVALQSNQHNGPLSPIMYSLPCETEERVHYINMPAAVQVSLQHQWVLTEYQSSYLCPFPWRTGEERRMNG